MPAIKNAPMNGWARIGMVLVAMGCIMVIVAALWAVGLTNHAHRDYGWVLVAALGFSTVGFCSDISRKRDTLTLIQLLKSLTASYIVSVLGLGIVVAYSEANLFAGITVAAILIAPVLFFHLIRWIVVGFTSHRSS